MSSPVAVIIGDIHFTVPTLDLAIASLSAAREKAKKLNVPLVINGDTLDTKAIIRGECANAIIDVLSYIEPEQVYINTGNHDLISSKGTESSLNFLRPYANVVKVPSYIDEVKSWIIPYFDSGEELTTVLSYISHIAPGARLIMHQGVMGADMGHYVKDTSSLPKDVYADFRVIASHYHRRQDIKCGRPRKGAVGLFSYISNPYTLGFGEANDPEKGFQVLHDDGTLEFIPTDIRKHIVFDFTFDQIDRIPYTRAQDLIWVKITGRRSELDTLNKQKIAYNLGRNDFKLDLIPTDETKLRKDTSKLNNTELMDLVIDSTGESEEYRKELKGLWREVLEDT